jgi:hypothetical protein
MGIVTGRAGEFRSAAPQEEISGLPRVDVAAARLRSACSSLPGVGVAAEQHRVTAQAGAVHLFRKGGPAAPRRALVQKRAAEQEGGLHLGVGDVFPSAVVAGLAADAEVHQVILTEALPGADRACLEQLLHTTINNIRLINSLEEPLAYSLA